MSLVFSKKSLLENPEQYSKKINIKLLSIFINKTISNYEEGNPIISDTVFDIIYDVLKKRDPGNNIFKKVGYINKIEKNKVKLPYYMGSMDKIKDLDGIRNWCKKYEGPYVISEKLDGASATLQKKNGNLKLYSRGNGLIGKDISHLIKFIKVPDIDKDFTVRGELIISKENFKKYPEFTTARSMVNGLINKKTIQNIKDLDFVVFELLSYGIIKNISIGKQIKLLTTLGFNMCMNSNSSYKEITSTENNSIENSNILKILLEYRLKSKYDIDGIIITDDHVHEKPKEGNPSYSFAFKSNGLGKITKVKKVEWNVSKHRYLIPRIQIEPVVIDSNTINYTTGFNAKFIKDNSIGSGSTVRIVRSGDVIPYIIEIIEKSKVADMPDKDYIWTSTGVNIIEKNETPELNYKKITSFFRTLCVDNISEGIIKKLVDSGFDSIKKILLIKKEDLMQIDGIQSVLSNKLYNNIHIIIDNPIDISKLMVASLIFGRGFGLKKINKIIEIYPNFLEMDMNCYMINEIDGFSDKTSQQFIDNLSNFKDFIKELYFLKIKIPDKKSGDRFKNKKFVLTGFRDEKIMNYIENNGGKIVNSISKNTDFLIVKDKHYKSSKISVAEILGIKIIYKELFNFDKNNL